MEAEWFNHQKVKLFNMSAKDLKPLPEQTTLADLTVKQVAYSIAGTMKNILPSDVLEMGGEMDSARAYCKRYTCMTCTRFHALHDVTCSSALVMHILRLNDCLFPRCLLRHWILPTYSLPGRKQYSETRRVVAGDPKTELEGRRHSSRCLGCIWVFLQKLYHARSLSFYSFAGHRGSVFVDETFS